MLRACLFLVLLGGCAAAPAPAPQAPHVVIVTPPPVAPAPARKVHGKPFRPTIVGVHPARAPGYAHAAPVRRHGEPPRRHGRVGHAPGHHECSHPSHRDNGARGDKGARGNKGAHGNKDAREKGHRHGDAPKGREKKPFAAPGAQRSGIESGKGREPLGLRRL